MLFWDCVQYLAVTGIIAFFLGRLIPKKWFRADKFPFSSFAFEKNGKFYNKFKIRIWQNKVPDMSKILPKIMPAKSISSDYREKLPRMLQETCVAEFIHVLLCFSGLKCIKLWPGAGGKIIVFLYIVLFNLPYIMIQRYNRPRLLKLNKNIERQETKEGSVKTACVC